MQLISLLSDESVKRIIVEKESFSRIESSNSERALRLNLQILVEYDVSENFAASVTVEDYIKKWLYEVKANTLKPSSFDRKEEVINYQIIPYIGGISIHSLSSDDIQAMINELKKSYSYSTVKKAYECINACLKYAVKKRDLLYNAAESVTIPKNTQPSDGELRFFTEDEMRLIMQESVRCHNNGNRVYRIGGEMITFLLNTGLRIGEALALEWQNVDFKKQLATVRSNVVYVKDRSESNRSYCCVKQLSTKTRNGSRIIPLNSEAMRALISLKGLNGNTPYVFATKNGKRITPRNIDRTFRSILKRCGIACTGVHSLRHTFASRLFAKGVDVKTVSELLGHSDVGITYDTYIHLIQEQRITAVKAIEDI